MTLTINEKQKLYNKANDLYNKIANIKLRDTINLNIDTKYYNKNYRTANCDFNIFCNGICIYGYNIKDMLIDLKNYLDFKLNGGSEYVNNKIVGCIYDADALLDFIYNGDYIVNNVERQNKQVRNDLENLLN